MHCTFKRQESKRLWNDEFRIQNDELKTSLSVHHSSLIVHRSLGSGGLDFAPTGVIESCLAMTAANEIRPQFAQEISQGDDQVNLARAALLMAQEEYPDLPVEAYLDLFDEMAQDSRSDSAPSATLPT